MNKLKDRVISFFLHLELVIMSLIVIIPIVWIISSAFNEGTGLASSSLFPKNPTLDNFKRLFEETEYIKWFLNTLSIAVVNTVVSVIIILTSSWILSRFNFRGKKAGLMTILILSMFPSFLSMTAIYTLFLTLGLLDTPIALVIIYSAGAIPYNAWLVKGYLDGIPKSMDEAAYIDGSSRIRTFFQIILPLSTPIITYVAVTQFMAPWMDFILPRLLLTKSENKTLAVGLYDLINTSATNNFTMFAAGAILIAIPITILFFIFQKSLSQGITSGANKE